MEQPLRTITRDELQRKINDQDDFILVETLAPESFQQGRLPGAVNLPPDRIRTLAPELLPDKHADIIVYCARLT